MASQQQTGRAASRARRQMQVNGKGRTEASTAASSSAAPSYSSTSAKNASRERRRSLAANGKRADKSNDRQRADEMEARAHNASSKDDCGCGGECCDKTAESAANTAAMKNSALPTVRVARKRPLVENTGRMLSRARRAAMSGRGKAGLEALSKGSSSASFARQANPDISGRDLARVVRESRSKGGSRGNPSTGSERVRRPRNAAEARLISGTKVGHSEKLTGDETGLCHTGITGTSYMSSEVFDQFCQSASPKVPKKVEVTSTLSGRKITSGGTVGGSTLMTGNEAGSCREVTGSEYLGSEHFGKLCNSAPKGTPAKVSYSKTNRGIVVSGPKSSRSENVTGNEKGTCKAVTGTPYTGFEQSTKFCSTDQQKKIQMRSVMPAPRVRDISGTQPGVVGKQMTGGEVGACQNVSGTPYLGATDQKMVCGAVPARLDEADFPKPLSSVVMASPVKQDVIGRRNAVTGSGYEGEGLLTGAFAMGKGKVTGTEQARFGNRVDEMAVAPTPIVDDTAIARVTGEGIDTGLRITGDDWDRGDRVTGTEGSSAIQRNPSRRGAVSAMPQVEPKRTPQRDRPSAPVTGGSGGSEGAAVTVSGGARG